MKLYHYRSISSALLEIENGTFHFASKEELNDPLEGFVRVFWQGDKMAWDNLIKCNDICTENAGCIPLFQTGSATLTKSNVTGITEHNTGVPCYYKCVEKD